MKIGRYSGQESGRESGREDRRENGREFGRDWQTKPLPDWLEITRPEYTQLFF